MNENDVAIDDNGDDYVAIDDGDDVNGQSLGNGGEGGEAERIYLIGNVIHLKTDDNDRNTI